MTNIIPPAISQLQESFFRTVNADGDTTESTSTHPCHCLSIPAAKLFWCRHCMQIFEDPITRWRHSKTCLHSSGKMRKDKEWSTMQVFLGANKLAELRRDQNKDRVVNKTSRRTDLRCFICKTSFASIEEMRAHVRTPCRKRPNLLAPKHEYSPMPAEVKTQIQIPESASEIIYIKDGHQTVISLESPYQTNVIEQTAETQISTVETVIPVLSKTEDLAKPMKNRNENKENNVRKRKRILPKELDDLPNVKTTNLSPKSDQHVVTLGLSTRTDDDGDVLDNFESPPIKVSKVDNQDHAEGEEASDEVQTRPLQTNEAFGQLLTSEENKDHQPFLPPSASFLEENDSIQNRVITEQIPNESTVLKIPNLPLEEKIVTGDAAEARLKDLFTTIEIENANKLSPPSQPLQTACSFPVIQNKEVSQSEALENEGQSSFSVAEEIDPSGLLLYMPPINAGSVTLPDPLIDLRSGLPAEMLLDETTNTKPAVLPPAADAINGFVASNIMAATKLPSHIFDGDLLPSHIHSDVLFEEVTDEKEASHQVKRGANLNLEESRSGVDKLVQGVTEEGTLVGEALSVEVVSSEIATGVKEPDTQTLAAIEKIPLPDVVDHVEEIAQPFRVDSIREISNEMATAVPIKEMSASAEAAATVETVAQVLETTIIETLSTVEGVTTVESVSPLQEPPVTEIGSPDKELIPVKTLTPTQGTEPDVDKKSVETVDQSLEPLLSTVQPSSPTEAVSPIEESTHIKEVSPVHSSISPETISPIMAATAAEDLSQIEVPVVREAVSPVPEISAIEDQDVSKDTELATGETMTAIDTAVQKMETLEQTSSLKTSESIAEIPSERSRLVQIKNEKPLFPLEKSLEISNKDAEANSEDTDSKSKEKDVSDDDELETSMAEKADRDTKFKSTKLFKCKACSNTFKTPQALQKHTRVPCKVKHTRSLSQKILRPKQPCLKIEKKPMKKKLIKPARRPKLLIPIIPITRSELIRPAVPRRPKRFSRRKRKKVFFMDEQHHILPFVNVLMSELSDKDRFFYKLGMMNQCRKISCSPDPTTTIANSETSAVETLCDSAERSSSDFQSSGIKTEVTTTFQISSVPSAQIVADESLGISSAAFLEAARVSDKENSEGLSVPTMVKIEDNQFYDPSNDHRKVIGQSPCWEAAPRLAQLPGVMEIVRVTSANPSSADMLAGSDAPNKTSLEGNQNNVLANCQSLPFCDSSMARHSKEQTRKLAKELMKDPDFNLSCRTAKKIALKCETDEEPFRTVFLNGDSTTETIALSEPVIKEEPSSDVVKREIDANLTDNDLNTKTRRKSNHAETNKQEKVLAENKNHAKNAKVDSGINKNSARCKQNDVQPTKKNLIESLNFNKNQKEVVCMMRENERPSTDRNASNSPKSSASLSRNKTSLSSKKSSDQPRCGSSKKIVSNIESPKADLDLCTNTDKKSSNANALSNSSSSRKQTRSQQAMLKKDKSKLIVKNCKDSVISSSPQSKISSIVSTRSSPHRKAVGKHVSPLNSMSEMKRQSPRSQKLENIVGKKSTLSKDKIMLKTPHNNKNNNKNNNKTSLHISKSSKKLFSILPEKLSLLNKESRSEDVTKLKSKGSKPAKPCSKRSPTANPSRVTRRTQKTHDSKALLKRVKETSKDKKSLTTNDLKNSLQKSPDRLPRKEDDILLKNKSHEKVSGNQNRISQAESSIPPSETIPQKHKTLDTKFVTRIRQRSGSPCANRSDLAAVPHRRTRSKSDQGTIGDFSVSAGSDSILEYSMSSHARNVKEPVTNLVSVNSQTVSNKETSISEVYSRHASDKTSSVFEQVYLQNTSNKEISVSEQVKQEPKNSLVIDSSQTHERETSHSSRESNSTSVAVSVGQECDLSRSTTKSTTNETVLKREELKDDIKSSFSTFVDCASESLRIETTPEKTSLNSGVVDAHKTEVSVTDITTTTESSCSDVVYDNVMEPCQVASERSLQNAAAVVNVNPRISIATQTDSSFIQDTIAGVIVQPDSCNDVENQEIPFSTSNADVPIPSPPTEHTTLRTTEGIPEENVDKLSQENIDDSANEKPFPVEVGVGNDYVADGHQLSPVAPSLPGDPCPYVQNEVVLQENVEIINDPLQQSVAVSSETEPHMQQQQLMFDGTADHDALIQYLSSLDPSLLQQGVTFVIIQGTPGENAQSADETNFVIDPTAFSGNVEQDSDNSSIIYALHQQSDIVVPNETEVLTMDSS